jgi:hypothetical protein
MLSLIVPSLLDLIVPFSYELIPLHKKVSKLRQNSFEVSYHYLVLDAVNDYRSDGFDGVTVILVKK